MISKLQTHARAIFFMTFGLVLLGVYALVSMPVSIFPQLTIPRIMIAAEGGDAPAGSVLVTVTRPLEQAFSTLPELEMMQSNTTRGAAGFTLTFHWGADTQQALQLVNARIAETRSSLPPDLDISAERLNPTIFPILDYSVTSKVRSLADLRKLAVFTIRPRLARLPGVARVIVDGGQEREFHVTVVPERLAAYHVSVGQVTDALNKANSITAVGSYDNHYLRHLVLVNGLLNSIETIRRVVVDVRDRVPVTVGDVADVDEGVQRQTVIATGSGAQAVLVNIVRQPNGNTIQVADEVKRELASLRATLPGDVEVKPFYDQSQLVHESQASVVEAILIGAALALIVLVGFLRNMRTAAVALSLLPLTLAITFGLMSAAGLDLNIMTLGALAIALGLVIDDSIVVVEHIYHHLEQGAPRDEAVRQALGEITPAMIASSLASVVTFVPLLLLPGVTGNFLYALAVTLILTLGVSLALALVVCPSIAWRIFPTHLRPHPRHSPLLHPENGRDGDSSPLHADAHPGESRPHSPQDRKPGRSERIFFAILRFRWVLMALLVPLGIVAWILSQKLTTGFMPEFDEGAFVIDYHMPPGTSLAETDRVMRQVEDILANQEGVASWSRLSGAQSGSGLEITPQNQGDVLVQLKSGKRPDSDDITSDVRTKILTAVPNIQVDFAQILGDLIGDLSGSPSPIEVKIFGPDMTVLKRLASRVGDKISSIHGVVDESDGVIESGPQTEVRVDPVRAAEAGLSTDSVTAAVQSVLDGAQAGSVLQGEILEPIRVRYPGPVEPQMDASQLAGVRILTPTGQPITLGAVADVAVEPGSPDLNRENQRLLVSVTARLDHLDLGTAVRQVQAKLAGFALPPGYSIELGGLYKSQQQSFHSLAGLLLMAIVLVSSVLIATFRSFRVVVALLVAAILSLSGVIFALYLTGTPLNISSFTGAIMIVGIVTENGVLLFDELQRLQDREPELRIERLLARAGAARLRPILMTTFTAILALLPLSLGIGAGAAMQKPLAIAVIGGLALSMLFTLLVAPSLYGLMTGVRNRLLRIKS